MVLHMSFLVIMQNHLDPYHSLPLEKAMIFHRVIILVKSVSNKDKNNYYYNIFLEQALYELSKKFCIKYKCYTAL